MNKGFIPIIWLVVLIFVVIGGTAAVVITKTKNSEANNAEVILDTTDQSEANNDELVDTKDQNTDLPEQAVVKTDTNYSASVDSTSLDTTGVLAMKVRIDKDGDGTFESEFVETDGTLTQDEFLEKTTETGIVNDIDFRNTGDGWPIKIQTTISVTGSVEIFEAMAVIKLIPTDYENPEAYTLTVSGLPKKKDLHIYTEGYRVHEVLMTSSKGELVFDVPVVRGFQVIIKETEA